MVTVVIVPVVGMIGILVVMVADNLHNLDGHGQFLIRIKIMLNYDNVNSVCL